MTLRDRLKDQIGELAMQVHELADALDRERAVRLRAEAERDAVKAGAGSGAAGAPHA
jgi:hypothetical protein